MLYFATFFRWMHIFPAMALIGGIFFLRFSFQPAVRELEDEHRANFQDVVRRRWSKVVMGTASMLLLSGFVNMMLTIKAYDFPGGYYHPLLGLKLLLALAILYITSLLSGKSENAQKFREKESMWLNVNVGLAVVLLMVAGAMKTADRVEK